MVYNLWWPVPWQKFMQASFREYFVEVVIDALVIEVYTELVVGDATLVTGCNVVDVVVFVVIADDMVVWNVVVETDGVRIETDDPVTGIISTTGIWVLIAGVIVIVVVTADNTYEAVVLTPDVITPEVADFQLVVDVGDFEWSFDVCIFVAKDDSWSVDKIELNGISSFVNSVVKSVANSVVKSVVKSVEKSVVEHRYC